MNLQSVMWRTSTDKNLDKFLVFFFFPAEPYKLVVRIKVKKQQYSTMLQVIIKIKWGYPEAISLYCDN